MKTKTTTQILLTSLILTACGSNSIINEFSDSGPSTGGKSSIKINVSVSTGGFSAVLNTINAPNTGGNSSSSTGGQGNSTTGGSNQMLSTGGQFTNSTGGDQSTGGQNSTGGSSACPKGSLGCLCYSETFTCDPGLACDTGMDHCTDNPRFQNCVTSTVESRTDLGANFCLEYDWTFPHQVCTTATDLAAPCTMNNWKFKCSYTNGVNVIDSVTSDVYNIIRIWYQPWVDSGTSDYVPDYYGCLALTNGKYFIYAPSDPDASTN